MICSKHKFSFKSDFLKKEDKVNMLDDLKKNLFRLENSQVYSREIYVQLNFHL